MIHKLTDIHPEAIIGSNVTIDAFTSIQKNVEIGEGTIIGSNVTIMEGARIGKNCKIFPGAVISAIPQDLKYKGENTLAIIGDNTTIRECVTINKGTVDKMMTSIGNSCLVMAYSHVAHDCIIGNNCILANNTTLAGHITIGDYVILGGLTAIHQFVRIGSFSFVTGGSLVRKDIPPFIKAAREPISYVGVNTVGLKRCGFNNTTINHILDIYRILFVRGYNVSRALDIIEAEIEISEEREIILNFIRETNRGIMKGYTRRNNEDRG